jgi:hypothetical protein
MVTHPIAVGLKLVGRLPGPHGAAAFFMLREIGERFTLYSTRADGRLAAL